MHQPIRTILSITIAGLITQQAAHAGAFSLYTESSAAMLGNFAAGAAAEGADASIGWYNPAGLVLIHQQEAVISGIGVFPSSKLSGTSTFSTDGVTPYIQSFSNLQGAENALVPALHYALPLGPRATAGLSVVAPFGLSTNWGKYSPVRYQATLTDLKTINISPEIGGQLTDHFSIGGGIDFQWAQVKFNQVLGSPAALQFLSQFVPSVNPTTFDSLSYNKGHSFGIGFHAGILGQFNDSHTRIGLNYQSQIKHQFNGYSELTGPFADGPDFLITDATFRSNSLFSNTVALPDVTTLSIYQDINERLALLGSVVYAGWHSFNTIELNHVAAINTEDLENALVNFTSVENYKDAWRFAVGANYRFTPLFMMRIGTGYDQTPTVNAERDVRLPDANRWAMSIGGHYQMRPYLGFDLGYTYLWATQTPHINKTVVLDPLQGQESNVVARANNHVHLVGLQAVWMIDYQAPTKAVG